jgi:signal transduction histidine kinase
VLNAAAQAVEARVPVEQSVDGWWLHAMPLGDDAGDGVLVRVSADAAGDEDGSDLRRFVTGVNDAIDAPLRGIATYARAVVRDPAAATTPRFAESLLLQTEALRRAVDELLACSLAGMGPNDLRLERRDLARVVRDRVERARDMSPSVAITLQADAPIPAAVDEAVLGRALDALLASAMALSPSAVRVTVHPAVDRAVVSVELSRALPPRMRRSLLEPFRLSREGGGLGIGVILAKQVAQAHGGDLAVDDDGRTLRVRLPYPPATA